MSCANNHLKLPTIIDCDLVKCIKITMSNDEEYTVKVDDLVGIQFVKNDERILIRRGRIKDIILVNKKELSKKHDDVSRVILDCSEQFTVKIIEIKLKDIIKIGGINTEFEDYSDRITHLTPNFIEDNKIPTREHGMITEKELIKKITKPDMDDVVKMDPDTGIFNDLIKASSYMETVAEKNKNDDEKEPVKRAGMVGIPLMM